MKEIKKNLEPNNTAVRTALWRALHVQIDSKLYIIEDEIYKLKNIFKKELISMLFLAQDLIHSLKEE